MGAGVASSCSPVKTIILVEQNLGLALKVADDVVLLSTGRVVFSGTRQAFQAQQSELHAHLGIT
jgi:branched-chain amino acid transport system ATP-binding protein